MHFGCGVNISLHLTEANWVPPAVGIFIDAAKRQNPERRGLAIINTIGINTMNRSMKALLLVIRHQ